VRFHDDIPLHTQHTTSVCLSCWHNTQPLSAQAACIHNTQPLSAQAACIHNTQPTVCSSCWHNTQPLSAQAACIHNTQPLSAQAACIHTQHTTHCLLKLLAYTTHNLCLLKLLAYTTHNPLSAQAAGTTCCMWLQAQFRTSHQQARSTQACSVYLYYLHLQATLRTTSTTKPTALTRNSVPR